MLGYGTARVHDLIEIHTGLFGVGFGDYSQYEVLHSEEGREHGAG